MATAPNDAAAATQKQLLALVQAKGNAEKALRLLAQSGVADELSSPSSNLEKATTLLRVGTSVKLSRAANLKRTKESDKQWALVAAKAAQGVIKLYIGGSAAASDGAKPLKPEETKDLVTALDLATLALSVSCQFEALVKLGDFVLDNMLYQVAKKLSEIPQTAGRSLWIFAALHLRLWHQHSCISSTLNQKLLAAEISPLENRVDELLKKRNTIQLELDDLELMCTFPVPQNFHTLQFTRFLISLVNTAVTMLLASGKNKVILEVVRSLEPWITHLGRIPGVDTKLAASFSDRMFRVLWKCAAIVDAKKSPSVGDDQDQSLEYRSLALSFMLKCPNYSNAYFVQQVHRVGVQCEKKKNPVIANNNVNSLQKFYVRSANTLFEERIRPSNEPKSSMTDWDYVSWLEHFASICDQQPCLGGGKSRIDALVALHHAIDHLPNTDTASRIIKGCFLLTAGSIVAETRLSSESAPVRLKDTEIRRILSSDLFHSTIRPEHQDVVVAALGLNDSNTRGKLSVDPLEFYLDGIHGSCRAAREDLSAFTEGQLGLALRLVRKASTHLFSISSTLSIGANLALPSLIASADLLRRIRTRDETKITGGLEDSFMSLEGRIRRFSVCISAKQARMADGEDSLVHLAAMTQQISLFQALLNHAMLDSWKQSSVMGSLLNDLQAIARESYVCASSYYKKQHYDLVELSVEAAFELSRYYLEQVMCNEEAAKNPSDIEAAHGSLKVDALAGLLAFSCRQQGKLSLSRKYQGHAILYSSDPASVATSGVIDKYVNAIIDESNDPSCEQTDENVLKIVCSLCESTTSAWSARGIQEELVASVTRMCVDSFERFSARLLDQLRSLNGASNDSVQRTPRRAIKLCSEVVLGLWRLLWARGDKYSASLVEPMEQVLSAISNRNTAFCQYLLDRNSSLAVSGLWAARNGLTLAIESLSTPQGANEIDVGGCYGWRGVFTLEVCQMERYFDEKPAAERDCCTSIENEALDDIRQCLQRWRECATDVCRRSCTYFFDSRGVAFCLDAICHALFLMSNFQLESEARALLSKVHACSGDNSTSADFAVGLPSIVLQPTHLPSEATADDGRLSRSQESLSPDDDSPGILRLSLIDADIGLCLASVNAGDVAHARIHLSSAVREMDDLRLSVKISTENSHHYSAVAMREIALLMAESEVVFHEGDIGQAIRAAKSALSICWRISRRVGILEPDRERLELPEEVKAALGKHADQAQKASQLMSFQAIECWSWDTLLAAKLTLSRIAYLYVLQNEPFRSSVYHAEAMTLVRGVVPNVTRTRPFFEFEQLQILAERTSHATAVHQLVTVRSDSKPDIASNEAKIDTSVIVQNCEVQIQRGDLCLLEEDMEQAEENYERSLRLLERADQSIPAVRNVACGCLRRILKLELRAATAPFHEDKVARILETLKKLKKALKKCPDIVEHALSTCQLVRASLALLRSGSSKAFLPADKLATFMIEVLSRCDHLGVVHVTQEARLTMGLVCLMRSESSGDVHDDNLGASINWAAAGLLSSYHVMGPFNNEDRLSVEGDNGIKNVSSVVSGLNTCIQQFLPPTWLIVSIIVDEQSDLTISIIPTNGLEPTSFWMGEIKWQRTIQELNIIIETSRRTLFENNTSDSQEWTAEKKKQWWNIRKELDDRLRNLVTKLQASLSFWRALLTFLPDTQPSNSISTLLKEIALKIHNSPRSLTARSIWLISAVQAANSILSDDELLQCIDHVALEENTSIQHELAKNLVSMIRASRMSALPVQSVSTILVLHHRLEGFPWEGLDVLSGRSVTRMPSIEVILRNAAQSRSENGERSDSVTAYADPSSVSFLLNPAGDLKSTQSNLEPLFRRGEAQLAWRGVVGEVPEEEWMRQALLESSLFVFCGHGSGEKYFHRDKIAALRGHGCAAALLFGCSSGRVEREGVFGPNGAVISYLQAGSPAVVAMLWDVTDKDVDLMSRDILENWLLGDSERSISPQGEILSTALQRSRRLCKLQYLNGLAAVCYGLPLRVKPRSSDVMGTPEPKRRKMR